MLAKESESHVSAQQKIEDMTATMKKQFEEARRLKAQMEAERQAILDKEIRDREQAESEMRARKFKDAAERKKLNEDFLKKSLEVKKEIEEKVKEWANSDEPSAVEAREELFGKKGKSNKLEGAAIADIVFSFNNADLITALRTRGGHIAAQDFDAMRAEEDKINGLFQDFDKLTIPTDAFITFERDDAAEFAKSGVWAQRSIGASGLGARGNAN